jgi:hypothetical protein
MVSKVTVGEVMAQVDEAIVESPNPMVTMTVVEKSALEAAGYYLIERNTCWSNHPDEF